MKYFWILLVIINLFSCSKNSVGLIECIDGKIKNKVNNYELNNFSINNSKTISFNHSLQKFENLLIEIDDIKMFNKETLGIIIKKNRNSKFIRNVDKNIPLLHFLYETNLNQSIYLECRKKQLYENEVMDTTKIILYDFIVENEIIHKTKLLELVNKVDLRNENEKHLFLNLYYMMLKQSQSNIDPGPKVFEKDGLFF